MTTHMNGGPMTRRHWTWIVFLGLLAVSLSAEAGQRYDS